MLSHQNNFDIASSPFTITQGTLANSNYTITYVGNTLTLARKTLTDTTFTAANKTYDSTTSATITGDGSLVGVVGTDTVTLNNASASATFDNRNVGTTHVVTASGFTLAGAQAGDYTLTQPSTAANVHISAEALTVTANAQSATYGDTLGALTYTVSGGSLQGSDTFFGALGVSNGIGGTATAGTVLSHQNNFDVAGSPFAITRNGFTVSDGNGGGNYAITYVGNTLTLARKTLTDTTFSVANKTYDGTTSATITGNGSLVGVVGTDTVTLSSGGASAAFDNANVGTTHTVTASGYALGGAQAGDYTLSQPTASNVTISAAALTVTATNESQTYGFGGNSAALGTTNFSVTGGTLYGTDSVTGVTLSTNDTQSTSNNYKAGSYNLTPSTATGSGLSNYTITYATDTNGLTVNKAGLTVTGLAGTNKVYDTTTSDTITGVATLSGKGGRRGYPE